MTKLLFVQALLADQGHCAGPLITEPRSFPVSRPATASLREYTTGSPRLAVKSIESGAPGKGRANPPRRRHPSYFSQPLGFISQT